MDIRSPRECLEAEKLRLEKMRGKVVREIGLARKSRADALAAADGYIATAQADLDQLDKAVLSYSWCIRKVGNA